MSSKKAAKRNKKKAGTGEAKGGGDIVTLVDAASIGDCPAITGL